ncbi:MAG: hypothetical protein AAGA85_27245, partial [Bacteroidota bacterium]
QNPKKQGIYRDPFVLESRFQSVGFFLVNILVPVTANQRVIFEQTSTKADEFLVLFEEVMTGPVTDLRQRVVEQKISLF